MKTLELWNTAKPADRLKLLRESGYAQGKAYAYRAWQYIPSWVRVDVTYTAQRRGLV